MLSEKNIVSPFVTGTYSGIAVIGGTAIPGCETTPTILYSVPHSITVSLPV